jgi:hypothetical protein
MSLSMVLEDAVFEAEALAAVGERQIAQQRRLLMRLLNSGRSTAACEMALAALLDLQRFRIRDIEYWRSRATAPLPSPRTHSSDVAFVP